MAVPQYGIGWQYAVEIYWGGRWQQRLPLPSREAAEIRQKILALEHPRWKTLITGPASVVQEQPAVAA